MTGKPQLDSAGANMLMCVWLLLFFCYYPWCLFEQISASRKLSQCKQPILYHPSHKPISVLPFSHNHITIQQQVLSYDCSVIVSLLLIGPKPVAAGAGTHICELQLMLLSYAHIKTQVESLFVLSLQSSFCLPLWKDSSPRVVLNFLP